MSYTKTFSIVIAVLLTIWIAGCVSESTAPVVQPTKEIATYKPRGTISGKIQDLCTNQAVSGAVLSVGYDGNVFTVTSDQSGSFSFADVPAGVFSTTGGGMVITGSYTLTASLVNYNASQSDPTKHYRNYYYLPVTITFTSLVPGDSLGVSGLVGSVLFSISNLNTQIAGTIVDKNMQAVANALVTLFDQTVVPGSVLAQTTTSATGAYKFSNIDNGISVSITARSSDGSLQTPAPVNRSIPCNLTNDTLRSQVTIERIMITPVDNVNPFVILISPANNADVAPSNFQIVYTFSEPIKQTLYTRTNMGPGYGTILDNITVNYNGLKKGTGVFPFTVQWDSTYTQFTVSPQGVVGSAKYSVSVQPAFSKLTDLAGNAVVNNPTVIGDFETLNLTTNGSSPLPAAPAVVRRSISGTFDPLDYTGGVVGLEWNYDANARSYNIYKSIDGGSFTLLQTNYQDIQFQDNTGPLFVGSLPDPLSAGSVSYKVVGVSRDLVEGTASNAITLVDEVSPKVVWPALTIDSTSANARGNDVYYITVHFSEPLNVTSTETSPATKYVFSNTTVPLTVTKADYLGAGQVYLTVNSLGGLKPNGNSRPALTIQNAVTDLQSNVLNTTNNANVYQFPMYFYDSFEAVWTNGGTTPPGWTANNVVGTANWAQKQNPLIGQAAPAGNLAQDGQSVATFATNVTAGWTTRIESPVIDLSSSSNPFLVFYYVNTTGTDILRIRVSTDGGTTWNTIRTLTTTPSSLWVLESTNLTGAAGQSNVKIGLEAVADNGTSDIWVDNVNVVQ